MEAIEITLSTFPQFMNLALKLRQQIWQDHLSEKVEPIFYSYKEERWQDGYLTEGDQNSRYDAKNQKE